GNKTHQGDPQNTKFQPRLGFAWTITPGTVLRGGYGIFYAPLPMFFPEAPAYGSLGFAAPTQYFASADGGLTPAHPNGITKSLPAGFAEAFGQLVGLADQRWRQCRLCGPEQQTGKGTAIFAGHSTRAARGSGPHCRLHRKLVEQYVH